MRDTAGKTDIAFVGADWFTHADVKLLQEAALSIYWSTWHRREVEGLKDLAKRIEALLPEREDDQNANSTSTE